MSIVRVVIRPEDLQDGDVLITLQDGADCHDSWAGMYVKGGQLYYRNGGLWAQRLPTWPYAQHYRFLVERDAGLVSAVAMSAGVFPTGAVVHKVVDDWPLACPRCKRTASAYLGLNDYDCKHGCYRPVTRAPV